MKNKNMENVAKVSFIDTTNYEPEHSVNGGAYAFWTDYERQVDGTWKESHGTSAEFFYCPVGGMFCNFCSVEEIETNCGCKPIKFLSEAELLKKIEDYKEDDEHSIVFE